jgi:hypothetical protein
MKMGKNLQSLKLWKIYGVTYRRYAIKLHSLRLYFFNGCFISELNWPKAYICVYPTFRAINIESFSEYECTLWAVIDL